MKYEGGANLRAPLEANVYDTGAPRDADIHYHHEMAYVGQSCKWVAFGAISATDDPLKGATFISLNNPATEEIMQTKERNAMILHTGNVLRSGIMPY